MSRLLRSILNVFLLFLLLVTLPSCILEVQNPPIKEEKSIGFAFNFRSLSRSLNGATLSVDVLYDDKIVATQKETIDESKDVISLQFENLPTGRELLFNAKVEKDGIVYFTGSDKRVLKITDEENPPIDLNLKSTRMSLKFSSNIEYSKELEGATFKVSINNQEYCVTIQEGKPTEINLGYLRVGDNVSITSLIEKDGILLYKNTTKHTVTDQDSNIVLQLQRISVNLTLDPKLDLSIEDLVGAKFVATVNDVPKTPVEIKKGVTSVSMDIGLVETGKPLTITGAIEKEIIVDDKTKKFTLYSITKTTKPINQNDKSISLDVTRQNVKLIIESSLPEQINSKSELLGAIYRVHVDNRTLEHTIALDEKDAKIDFGYYEIDSTISNISAEIVKKDEAGTEKILFTSTALKDQIIKENNNQRGFASINNIAIRPQFFLSFTLPTKGLESPKIYLQCNNDKVLYDSFTFNNSSTNMNVEIGPLSSYKDGDIIKLTIEDSPSPSPTSLDIIFNKEITLSNKKVCSTITLSRLKTRLKLSPPTDITIADYNGQTFEISVKNGNTLNRKLDSSKTDNSLDLGFINVGTINLTAKIYDTKTTEVLYDITTDFTLNSETPVLNNLSTMNKNFFLWSLTGDSSTTKQTAKFYTSSDLQNIPTTLSTGTQINDIWTDTNYTKDANGNYWILTFHYVNDQYCYNKITYYNPKTKKVIQTNMKNSLGKPLDSNLAKERVCAIAPFDNGIIIIGAHTSTDKNSADFYVGYLTIENKTNVETPVLSKITVSGGESIKYYVNEDSLLTSSKKTTHVPTAMAKGNNNDVYIAMHTEIVTPDDLQEYLSIYKIENINTTSKTATWSTAQISTPVDEYKRRYNPFIITDMVVHNNKLYAPAIIPHFTTGGNTHASLGGLYELPLNLANVNQIGFPENSIDCPAKDRITNHFIGPRKIIGCETGKLYIADCGVYETEPQILNLEKRIMCIDVSGSTAKICPDLTKKTSNELFCGKILNDGKYQIDFWRP